MGVAHLWVANMATTDDWSLFAPGQQQDAAQAPNDEVTLEVANKAIMASLAEKDELTKDKSTLEQKLQKTADEAIALRKDLEKAKSRETDLRDVERKLKDKNDHIGSLEEELLDTKQAVKSKDAEISLLKKQNADMTNSETNKLAVLEEEKRLLERVLRDSQ